MKGGDAFRHGYLIVSHVWIARDPYSSISFKMIPPHSFIFSYSISSPLCPTPIVNFDLLTILPFLILNLIYLHLYAYILNFSLSCMSVTSPILYICFICLEFFDSENSSNPTFIFILLFLLISHIRLRFEWMKKSDYISSTFFFYLLFFFFYYLFLFLCIVYI